MLRPSLSLQSQHQLHQPHHQQHPQSPSSSSAKPHVFHAHSTRESSPIPLPSSSTSKHLSHRPHQSMHSQHQQQQLLLLQQQDLVRHKQLKISSSDIAASNQPSELLQKTAQFFQPNTTQKQLKSGMPDYLNLLRQRKQKHQLQQQQQQQQPKQLNPTRKQSACLAEISFDDMANTPTPAQRNPLRKVTPTFLPLSHPQRVTLAAKFNHHPLNNENQNDSDDVDYDSNDDHHQEDKSLPVTVFRKENQKPPHRSTHIHQASLPSQARMSLPDIMPSSAIFTNNNLMLSKKKSQPTLHPAASGFSFLRSSLTPQSLTLSRGNLFTHNGLTSTISSSSISNSNLDTALKQPTLFRSTQQQHLQQSSAIIIGNLVHDSVNPINKTSLNNNYNSNYHQNYQNHQQKQVTVPNRRVVLSHHTKNPDLQQLESPSSNFQLPWSAPSFHQFDSQVSPQPNQRQLQSHQPSSSQSSSIRHFRRIVNNGFDFSPLASSSCSSSSQNKQQKTFLQRKPQENILNKIFFHGGSGQSGSQQPELGDQLEL